MSAKPSTKTFGKSTRAVPATADKAQKWYNADDETDPKKVSLINVQRLAALMCMLDNARGERKKRGNKG